MQLKLQIEGSIVAPKDPKVWDKLDAHKWLYFVKVRHLTVQGGGTINGMGQKWWATSCKINTTNVISKLLLWSFSSRFLTMTIFQL